jgi:hypothetical protein
VHSGDKQTALVGLKVLGVQAESELAVRENSRYWKRREKPLSEAEQSLQDEWQVEIEADRPPHARTAVGTAVEVLNETGDYGASDKVDEPEGGRP